VGGGKVVEVAERVGDREDNALGAKGERLLGLFKDLGIVAAAKCPGEAREGCVHM
jgi:hypothetical protein